MWYGANGVGNQGGCRLNFNAACCGTGFALTNPGLASPAVAREASTQGDREHRDLAQGQAQRDVRRLDGSGRRVAAEPDAGADGELRPARPPKRRTAFSTRRRCRARPRPTSRRRKNSLRDADRPHHLARRRRAHQRRRATRIRPLGMSRAEGRMREFDFFAADSWRMTPERHRERRAALRAGEPVLSDQQQLHDGAPKPALHGVSGVGNLFKPGTLTGYEPASCSIQPAHAPTTPTATTSRRAPGSRGSCPDGQSALGQADLRLGGRATASSARGARDGLPAAGHVGLHRHVRRQPGHSRSNAARAISTNAARCRSCCGTSADAAGRAGGDLSDRPDGHHEQRQRVRLEPADAVHAVVYGRLAAQAGRATRRSSCATSAAVIVRTGTR